MCLRFRNTHIFFLPPQAQTVLKALEDAQENGLGQFLTGTLQQCTWDSLVAWLVTGDPLACDTVKVG